MSAAVAAQLCAQGALGHRHGTCGVTALCLGGKGDWSAITDFGGCVARSTSSVAWVLYPVGPLGLDRYYGITIGFLWDYYWISMGLLCDF